MSRPGDLHGDMERFALDSETGDRLLSGVLDPEDAPDRYSAVAALLHAAAVPTSGDLDGQAATVDAVVLAIRSAPGFVATHTKQPRFGRAKVAVAGLVGALSLTSGLAAANALPGAAQQVAADALGVVGVHVPKPHDDKADHPDPDDPSASDTGKGAEGNVGADAGSAPTTAAPAGDGSHPDNKGAEISDLAHNTDPGPEHGATVSDAASDGKSHAGEPHGNPSQPDHPTGPPSSTPPGDQGNHGGNPSQSNNSANGNHNGVGSPGQDNAGGR